MSTKGGRRPATAAGNHVLNECVQVVVRCRPMSNKERSECSEEIVSVYPNRGVIEIANLTENATHKEQRKMFTYDAVYDSGASQTTVYNEIVFPLVGSVLEGYNGCIFAYGQTGTGKTFTMEGIRGNDELVGIIPRTFEQIWLHINRTKNFQFLVDVSYLEIYMEELRDLLKPNSKHHLEVRESGGGSGVFVPNLHAITCKSVDDMMNVMKLGNKNRTIGFTNMNEHSSRSHAIFMIRIEMCDSATNIIKVGKLNLIDLAGSERQTKTGASAERLKEASKINLALSSLGNVISALAENSPHVPYRDSKLTRLLQDSLGGNSKTIMIANIGPSAYNYNETLTTLRYASRAKAIQNQPIKNEDPQDAKLKEYQEEIERLKRLIGSRQQQQKVERPVRRVVRKANNVEKIDNNRYVKDDDGSDEPECVQTEKETEIEAEIESDREQEVVEEEVAKSNEQLECERLETAKLASKLAELESQLVQGGKDLLDTYSERQVELEKKLVEIADRKKREIEIQQKLELQEETTLEIRETVTSLSQEVDLKKRKLSKCYTKYLALQQELTDCKFEHNQDLRELEMAQNELVKELKRQLLIIDNFVPVEVKQRLYTQAKYDEEQEEWKFSPLSMDNNDITFHNKRPVAHPQRRRPVSEFAIAEAKVNPSEVSLRFKNENIVSYDLEMPCRTTQEYRTPKVSASLQAVLAQAMQTGDENEEAAKDAYTKSIRSRLESIINANSNGKANSQINGSGTGNTVSAVPAHRHAGRSRGMPASPTDQEKPRPPTGRSQLRKPASAYPKSRGSSLVNK